SLAQLVRYLLLDPFAGTESWNCDDIDWISKYMPLLVKSIPSNYPIWFEFWKLAKEEIREAQREKSTPAIHFFLSSIAKCLPHVNKAITGSEIAEMGEMIKEELVKCQAKFKDYEQERYSGKRSKIGEIVSSCARFVVDAHEVMGSRFGDVIQPTLPLLCSLLDGWKGEATMEKLVEYSAKNNKHSNRPYDLSEKNAEDSSD
ncbi:hypothetical protein PMAYCL1PPCAC_04204, partial [Pristionchus mayeri]